jgi:23S rRNA (pseudouridine1915-N3)-methyltransferase
MRLLAVGKAKQGPEQEMFTRYAKRLRPALELAEFAEGRGAPAEIKRREGQAILAAVPAGAFLVALDEAGVRPTSLELAAMLEEWLGNGKPLCFVIGGAEGLDQALIQRANRTLSLGSLTWPHMLVRVMLAEQLYRARSIAAGHPYHRAGRP